MPYINIFNNIFIPIDRPLLNITIDIFIFNIIPLKNIKYNSDSEFLLLNLLFYSNSNTILKCLEPNLPSRFNSEIKGTSTGSF